MAHAAEIAALVFELHDEWWRVEERGRCFPKEVPLIPVLVETSQLLDRPTWMITESQLRHSSGPYGPQGWGVQIGPDALDQLAHRRTNERFHPGGSPRPTVEVSSDFDAVRVTAAQSSQNPTTKCRDTGTRASTSYRSVPGVGTCWTGRHGSVLTLGGWSTQAQLWRPAVSPPTGAP